LQPVTLARWSSRTSIIHRLDARVKLAWLLAFVASLSLLRVPSLAQLAGALALLMAVGVCGRLPLSNLLIRAALVVPVVGLFSLIVYLSGDHIRAWAILSKTYLSALAVLLVASTTPLSSILEAARWYRVPAMLVEVTQLLHRYSFVLSSHAQQLRIAFGSRGGRAGRESFQASAGIIAVLFSRTYERATLIHRAMLGRGFDGTMPAGKLAQIRMLDVLLILVGVACSTAVHLL
jgi:cobalt/nickel transport system permease protein